MRLAINTYLYIAYAVEVLIWYCNYLGSIHYNLVIQIFRYLSKTFDFKIIFIINSKNEMISYINSNYIEIINNQKFTSGYIFILSDRSLYY